MRKIIAAISSLFHRRHWNEDDGATEMWHNAPGDMSEETFRRLSEKQVTAMTEAATKR